MVRTDNSSDHQSASSDEKSTQSSNESRLDVPPTTVVSARSHHRTLSTRSLNVIPSSSSEDEEEGSILGHVLEQGKNSAGQFGSSNFEDSRRREPGSALKYTTPNGSSWLSSEGSNRKDKNAGEGNEKQKKDDDSLEESGTTSSTSSPFTTASMESPNLITSSKNESNDKTFSADNKPIDSANSKKSHPMSSSSKDEIINTSQSPIGDQYNYMRFSANMEKKFTGFDFDYTCDEKKIYKSSSEEFSETSSEDEKNREKQIFAVQSHTARSMLSGGSKSGSPKVEKTWKNLTQRSVFARKVCLMTLFVFLVVSVSFNVYYTIRREYHPDYSNEHRSKETNLFDSNLDPGSQQNILYPGIAREVITKTDTEVKRVLNDPKLRQVFYGVDYPPLKVQHPVCGATQRDVTLDIAILSQVTQRIRLYGMDCRQAEFVLNAFIDLGLNMTLSMGVWLDRSTIGNNRQMEEMQKLVLRYPSKYIDSILVGNEVLFRGDMSESQLISFISQTQKFLKQHNIDIPVGTSDIGSKWSPKLASSVDVLAANIHPFLGGVPVHMSTSWTYEFLYDQVLVDKDNWSKVPSKILISEVGWPLGGGRFWGSVAGIEEQQHFLNDWVCSKQAMENVGWYWFEAFDEPWKIIYHDGDSKWKTQWGIFSGNKKLKEGLELPVCGQ